MAPPTPVDRSGRRFGAGPGHHALAATWLNGPSIVTLLVISAAIALMAMPGIVAALSMLLGDRVDGPKAPWGLPFDMALVLELGRVLLTLGLTTSVIRTTEEP